MKEKKDPDVGWGKRKCLASGNPWFRSELLLFLSPEELRRPGPSQRRFVFTKRRRKHRLKTKTSRALMKKRKGK